MFGKPAFAYSGVQTKMIPFVQQAPLFDASDSSMPGAYFREPGRYAPYNLFATPKKLLAQAPKASKAADIGFTFSDEPPPGGTPQKKVSVRYPAAQFTFNWSARHKRWLITQDGKKDMAAEGGQQGAPTIVIQWVKTERSQFHDFTGSYTPLVHTVGKAPGWSCGTARRTVCAGRGPRRRTARPTRRPTAAPCRSPGGRSGWCSPARSPSRRDPRVVRSGRASGCTKRTKDLIGFAGVEQPGGGRTADGQDLTWRGIRSPIVR